MLAVDVRHLELGIASLATAVLAVLAVPHSCPRSAPAMPAPSPEPVAIRHTAVSAIACDDPAIQTIVFTGRVRSHGPVDTTLLFQFAELPAGYAVMTGSRGEFEIRVPRAELGVVDLCRLPTSRRGAEFNDAQLSLSYELQFER